MKECPECKNRLFEYVDQETSFIQSVCWKCGHYEDNSPAFRLFPESFKNIMRNNPTHFMKKFAKPSTERKHGEKSTKSTDKDTEPLGRFCTLIGTLVN